MTPALAADDPAAVLLDDAGPGFRRVGDTTGVPGTVTRTFQHPNGQLQITMVSISPSVDVRDLFGTVSGRNLGLQPVQISGLPLARWFITPGATPANTPSAIVIFASRHAIFTAVLATDGSGRLPAVPTLLAIAKRQIEPRRWTAGDHSPEEYRSPRCRADRSVAGVAIRPLRPDRHDDPLRHGRALA